MSNRQATYTINLNNNVIKSLEQTEAAALRVDNVMAELNRTMSMFGLAFGAQYVINLGKDWVDTAANYEQAMLRIKNASIDAVHGIRNQFFITDVVDRFKLDLETSINAYGHFLFKIKNANLSSEKENKLFEQLVAVGKVSGLPQGEIDATIRNMSIMLGEGVLEARHLRALSYVHPQVIPFLADELGLKDNQRDEFSKLLKHSDERADEESKLQKLSQLISSGKLTKLGEPATLLLGAMDKYYDSIKDKIPETLELVESELNVLSNLWTNFKKDVILDDKGDLVEFLHDLGDGVKFISEHKDDIVTIAKEVGHLIKLYAEWRIAMFALQAPFGIIQFFRNEQSRLTSTLGMYIPTAQAANVVTNQLSTSQSVLNTEVEEYITAQNLATDADMRRMLGIEELNVVSKQATEQQIVQMDLFTESTVGKIGNEQELNLKLRQLEEERIAQTQFANQELLAIEEEFFAKKEALLLADRQKYGYSVFQKNNQYNAEVAVLEQQMVLDKERINSELLYIETQYQAQVRALREETFVQQQAQNSQQLLLFEEFTVAGVEANSKIASSAKLAADEAAAAWTASAAEAEAAWIALSESMTAATLGLANSANATSAAAVSSRFGSKAIAGLPALLSSAIMPVFIAGMAIEVADMLLPGNSKTKEGLNWRNWANSFLSLGFDFYGDNGEGVWGKAKRLGSEEGINKWIQDELDRYLNVWKFDFQTGQIKQPFLDPNRQDLYNVLKRAQEKANASGLNYDIMNLIDPVDQYGNRKTSNIDLYNLFKSKGYKSPYLLDDNNQSQESYFPYISLEAKHQAEEQSKTTKALRELNKGTSKLKGNTVTNIHISWTGGMNGMVNPTFTVSSDVDIENLEEKVGDIIVKKLTDAVNDAQYLH